MKKLKLFMGLGLVLSLNLGSVMAQDKLTRVEFLPDVSQSQYPDELLKMVRVQYQDLGEIKGELETQPYVMVTKEKIPGTKLVAKIVENGELITKVYNDTQAVKLISTYKIPSCGDVGAKWRLQIAAISDNNIVASEEFYHLIKGITEGCGVIEGEMELRRFCKTEGEVFGQQITIGGNSTSRLYIVMDEEFKMARKDKAFLAKDCREKMETSLRTKINGCLEQVKNKMNEDVSLNVQNRTGNTTYIIPPVDIVRALFKVENDKLQFQSCDSLEKTPAIH